MPYANDTNTAGCVVILKIVAFPFVHKVFERICTDGGFNPETNNTSIEADTSRNLLNPRDLGFPP